MQTSIEIPAETVSEENFTPLKGISEETKTSMDDHTYTFKHPTTPESKTKKTFQKLNKTRRLENSLKLSQTLVKSVITKKEILSPKRCLLRT